MPEHEELDRERVVAVALEQIDAGGPGGVSLQGIAARLGVPVPDLYRVVTGQEDLLEAIVAHLASRIEAPLDEQLTRSWQGYLQALAHRAREVMAEHPRAFALLATRHPAAPWLRPPLRSLSLVDDFLDRLIGHGFRDASAVRTYQDFTSFLLGHLLLESSMRGAETSPPEVALDEGRAELPTTDGEQDVREHAHLVRLRPLLAQDTSEEQFETALETLLNRLEMELMQ